MEASHPLFNRQPQLRAILRAAAFAVLAAVSFQAAAEPLTLYMYRDNGMPVYTDRKPSNNIKYTVIHPGSGASNSAGSTQSSRVTTRFSDSDNSAGMVGWAASCQGVSKAVLDERAAQWQSMVTKHAKAHGVPAALVRAVMRVESCFDPRAVSRVGARGLMQLMPDTAAHLGVRDSFDADQNIAGGARYLSQLLGRFNNDTRLAVAAYNAGPTAVDTYRGIPPFPETRSYVKRVITEYRESSDPKLKETKS